MGCFDTYIFPNCPWCGEEVEDQVKPGDMNYYRFGKDPNDDIHMRGHYTHWNGCGKSFIVDFEIPPKMVIKKWEEE